MLDGQLTPHVEGEEETLIPPQKLQHPAHQVLSGTLNKGRMIGPLQRAASPPA